MNSPGVDWFSWIFDIFRHSLDARESEVWIGNLNVNVRKSTEHKLHKI